MAMQAQFIKVGDRIINLAAIKFIKLDGASIVNVHMLDEGKMEQFVDAEAPAFLAAIGPYMTEIHPEK